MRGFFPVWKRELFSLFVTPLAWVVIVSFLVLQGLHFGFILLSHFANQGDMSSDQGPVQAFFGQTVFLYFPLVVFCPALTMRAFSEERQRGTIEALLTAPVSTAAVVVAKWAAAMVAYAAMWAPTLLYMVVIRKTGAIDWQVVGTGYLGIALVGASWLAIGTLASAMTQSVLLALVLGAGVTLSLFMIGVGEMILPEGALRDVCGYVSVWTQMDEMSRGIVDSRRVLFDLSLTALPLFVTTRVVDSWRWG
ncbi:MAG: ABC transporter permease subunit [Polyangiaceae bacterium]|nr:ABC transporter permease subunit [Polyangiaceae bacterium]